MSQNAINQYKPDFVTHPGDTLLEVLSSMGMSQAELAERTGRPKKTINEIIRGKANITPETAIQLERVLNIPASFWNNRAKQYEEYIALKEEEKRLNKEIEWIEHFPTEELAARGWIGPFNNKIESLQAILNYFGVATPEQWTVLWAETKVAYRQSRSLDRNLGAVAAWLRKGELIGIDAKCKPFDVGKFRVTLAEIRTLTVTHPREFQFKVPELCCEAGVAVAFVPEFPKMKVFGATRWITPNKALIQLSLYYKSDDHLWFTFFHEAGHLLLHGKRDLFVEGERESNEKEKAADSFAANFLIPEDTYKRFVLKNLFSQGAIRQFAQSIGIAPGIVVGRLQHDGVIRHNQCNDLKRRLKWVNSLE